MERELPPLWPWRLPAAIILGVLVMLIFAFDALITKLNAAWDDLWH